jgi:RES domain-containing protein
MKVYRITNTIYKDDISGSGAALFGARWNTKGFPLLYTSTHISLAALEMLVNILFSEVSNKYSLLTLQLPDNLYKEAIELKQLKNNWQYDVSYSQFIGTEFCKTKKTLALNVPSAVIAEERNILINPKHPDFKKIKIITSNEFIFDKRLFK